MKTRLTTAFLILSISLLAIPGPQADADIIERNPGEKMECVIVMKGPKLIAIKYWEPGMCEVKSMTLKKEDIVSLENQNSFEDRKILSAWEKQIWEACPQVREQAKIREERAKEREREEVRKESELKASSQYRGSRLTITNNNDYEWTNIEVNMNSGFLRSGYKHKIPYLAPGESYEMDLSDLAKGDGSRFQVTETKPTSLTISADTPENGRSHYFGKFK